jgi:ABC-type uncharacterized transport system YnjBCD substrate-binding protein
VYLSAYDETQIRSVTTLSQGKTLAKDILNTYNQAKGQVAVVAEMVGGEIYFTVAPWREDATYSRLQADGRYTESIARRVVKSFGFAYETE